MPRPDAPLAPIDLQANVVGGVVTFTWAPAASGSVPASYQLDAGSGPSLANLATLNTGSNATTFAAAAPPGTYYVRLRSVNACGVSAPTADVIVTINP